MPGQIRRAAEGQRQEGVQLSVCCRGFQGHRELVEPCGPEIAGTRLQRVGGRLGSAQFVGVVAGANGFDPFGRVTIEQVDHLANQLAAAELLETIEPGSLDDFCGILGECCNHRAQNCA